MHEYQVECLTLQGKPSTEQICWLLQNRCNEKAMEGYHIKTNSPLSVPAAILGGEPQLAFLCIFEREKQEESNGMVDRLKILEP